MRFDFITIFPEYFEPLHLSLLGKAERSQRLSWHVHNLRDWTHDKHQSVDDTPLGGGAGMVMRPDIWGNAIDQVLADSPAAQRVVLAIPTPAGKLLDQRLVENLATADQIVVACGRYEGIDARVAEHYRGRSQGVLQGRLQESWQEPQESEPANQVAKSQAAMGQSAMNQPAPANDAFASDTPANAAPANNANAAPATLEVLEFSLGDYVLNGGEIAGLVLAEAIGRLLDGVVGNPESLVEESHSSLGLLEYPVFTRPRDWRELSVPEVLLTGNHGQIDRWRRMQSLRRTALTRPDLLAKIPTGQLNSQDREVLAEAGWLIKPEIRPVQFRLAQEADLAQVAELAAATFPLACPDFVPEAQIQEFIREHLQESELLRLMREENARVCVAEAGTIGMAGAVGAAREADTTRALGTNSESEATGAAKTTGEFIAYTLTLPAPEEELPNCPPGAAYLSKCYTASRFQGSGISGTLIEFAVEDARQAYGCAAIALGTNINNSRAQKFYKRHGFKRVGRRKFLVGETENLDDVFVRELD